MHAHTPTAPPSCDRVAHVYRQLCAGTYRGVRIDGISRDEVQDFTQVMTRGWGKGVACQGPGTMWQHPCRHWLHSWEKLAEGFGQARSFERIVCCVRHAYTLPCCWCGHITGPSTQSTHKHTHTYTYTYTYTHIHTYTHTHTQIHTHTHTHTHTNKTHNQGTRTTPHQAELLLDVRLADPNALFYCGDTWWGQRRRLFLCLVSICTLLGATPWRS